MGIAARCATRLYAWADDFPYLPSTAVASALIASNSRTGEKWGGEGVREKGGQGTRQTRGCCRPEGGWVRSEGVHCKRGVCGSRHIADPRQVACEGGGRVETAAQLTTPN